MSILPPEEMPQGIHFIWGGDEESRVLDAVHYFDGRFEVDHDQLPPKVETATILRAAGVRSTAIAELVGTNAITPLTNFACDAHNMHARGFSLAETSRVPPLIGRLCLPGGILRNVEPISKDYELDAKSIQILSVLAQGKGWNEAARPYQREHQYALYHIKNNYYPEVVRGKGKLNVNTLLLHAYGAQILDPEDIVSKQEYLGPPPRLPLKYVSINKPSKELAVENKVVAEQPASESPAPALRLVPSQTTPAEKPKKVPRKRTYEKIEGIPEQFRPFEMDPDKVIHLSKSPDGTHDISHIEAHGAMLEVIDPGTIKNCAGQQITLHPNEKLALSLLALGATQPEVIEHCMSAYQFDAFRKKLGISLNHNGLADATLLACRELLRPINPPEWFNGIAPDYSWVSKLKASKLSEGGRVQIANESNIYMLQERPAYCGVNLMLALGHADDLISCTNS